MFRQAGLGPLIGKRPWGRVVGIPGRGPLLDGGEVYVPEFATANAKGKYVIEGHGVDPDIEVENDPADLIEGRDAQLARAIAEIEKALQSNPKTLPQRPRTRIRRRNSDALCVRQVGSTRVPMAGVCHGRGRLQCAPLPSFPSPYLPP